MKAMFRMVTMSGIKTFIDVNENSFLKKWKCDDNT